MSKRGLQNTLVSLLINEKNKWQAQITFHGKSHRIAYYENEEEAAIDYARAVFKYHGQEALDKARKRKSSGIFDYSAIDYARAVCKYKSEEALDKAREQNSSGISIDLSDVRPQQTPHQPILRIPKHGL